MIRLILVASFVIGFLLFFSGVLFQLKRLGKTDWETAEWKSLNIVRRAFSVILKTAGVKVTVKGAEHIPSDTPVLYVGNHRSYFDILVGYTTVPGLLGFVAKKEMLKIPCKMLNLFFSFFFSVLGRRHFEMLLKDSCKRKSISVTTGTSCHLYGKICH